jgi:hypothetical protein
MNTEDMEIIDCHSRLNIIKDDFDQLSKYIVNAQNYIALWHSENQTNNLFFEVPKELLTLLENLSKLTLFLFETTKSKLNEKQLKTLMGWEYATASSYCFIQAFIQIRHESIMMKSNDAIPTKRKKLTYQFYFDASYELRTPFSILKAYSQMVEAYPTEYLVPPFIPDHQDTLLEIKRWIEQVWEFVLALPEHIKMYQ